MRKQQHTCNYFQIGYLAFVINQYGGTKRDSGPIFSCSVREIPTFALLLNNIRTEGVMQVKGCRPVFKYTYKGANGRVVSFGLHLTNI